MRIFHKTTFLLLIFLLLTKLMAQYDTIHYIPPVYINDGDSVNDANNGTYTLRISTKASHKVAVRVEDGNGTLIHEWTQADGPEKEQPVSLVLGKVADDETNGTAVGGDGGGEESFEARYDGLVIKAAEPVLVYLVSNDVKYDNFSITSKGSTSKGTKFYTGTKITNYRDPQNNEDAHRAAIISVMATEPGITTVQFHIKEALWNVEPWKSHDLNSTNGILTATLQQGQTYIVYTLISDSYYYDGSNNGDNIHSDPDNDPFNGTLVTSDKNITVLSGTWMAYLKDLRGSGGSIDSGFDILVPVDSVGSDYILTRGRVGENHTYAENANIIATEDGTEVWMRYLDTNMTKKTTLNAGETFRLFWDENHSNVGEPMFVAFKKEGTSTDGINGEPVSGYVLQDSGGGSNAAEMGTSIIPSVKGQGLDYADLNYNANYGATNILIPVGKHILIDSTVVGDDEKIASNIFIGGSYYDAYSIPYPENNRDGLFSVTLEQSGHIGTMGVYKETGGTGLYGFYTNFKPLDTDVRVEKNLVTPEPYYSDGNITYTITVYNDTAKTVVAQDIYNVVVLDTPTNLDILTVTVDDGTDCNNTFPCIIPEIKVDKNVTLTVVTKAKEIDRFDNSVTVTTKDHDVTPENNLDRTDNNGTITRRSDLNIEKRLITKAPYYHGQEITYEVVIINEGPDKAKDVNLSDHESNLTIVSIESSDGTDCQDTFPCILDQAIDVDKNVTLTIKYTIAEISHFDNNASVISEGEDPDMTNNIDTTDNNGTALALVDVGITKDLDTSGPYYTKGEVVYTLTVTNDGPDDALGVVVKDIPTNLTITSVTDASGKSYDTNGSYQIGDLGANESLELTIKATIEASGKFDNNATVTSSEYDRNMSNNIDNIDNNGTALALVDVRINKDLDTLGSYYTNDKVVYTLTVTNDGPDKATDVNVTDRPTNLTITSVTDANNKSYDASAPYQIGDLGANESLELTIKATIDASGKFDNNATVVANEHDSNESNNVDNTDNNGTAEGLIDLNVTKRLDTAGPYYTEEKILYTIVVANAGPDSATNINIDDQPTNLTILEVNSSDGTDCHNSFPCTLAEIETNSSVTLRVLAEIKSASKFDNNVTVSADQHESNESNNVDNTDNNGTALPLLDINVTKRLETTGVYHTADKVLYTIVVANAGPDTATNINIDDQPTNLTILEVNSSDGTDCHNSFPCTLAEIETNSSVTLRVLAEIKSASKFDNNVTVRADQHDSNESNNVDSTDNNGTAIALVDISVDKSYDDTQTYYPGDEIVYTITIHNAGPDKATDLNVTNIPVNLTILSVEDENGKQYDIDTIFYIGDLDANASRILTIKATINDAGIFDINISVVSNQEDSNMSNNMNIADNNGTAYLLSKIGGKVLYENYRKERAPLAHVTVLLMDINGKNIAETQTDNDGKYLFTEVRAGKYWVQEVQPKGYDDVGIEGSEGESQDLNNILVVTTFGEVDDDNLFIDKRSFFHIGKYFWIDGSNGGKLDGLYQEGEELISGALVELLDENGKKLYWKDAEHSALTTTKTKWPVETKTVNGEYDFEVPAGKYRIRFHLPEKYKDQQYVFAPVPQYVAASSGENDDTHMNVAGEDGLSMPIEVGEEFGNLALLSIDAAAQCPYAGAVDKANGADAFGDITMLLMIMLMVSIGVYYAREEESYYKKG